MLYKCPECSKIYEEYVDKCPECGARISLSDSVSDAAARNMINAEEGEEKFNLLNKRIRNGYIAMALFFIAFVGISLLLFLVFDIPDNWVLLLTPVIGIVLMIILMVLTVKFHFFSCPYCDRMLKSHNALMSLYCPNCGKRIRK